MSQHHQTIIPTHLQIEPINGVCSARCSMCTIDQWTRKPHRMPIEVFESILLKFLPYQQHLQYLTLHGCGEPLFDPGLAEKIALAKTLGFHGTGFATNCTELTEDVSRQLLDAGLDTIICSVDGIKKETHEAIRENTNFESIVNHINQFITFRDTLQKPTRVLIRFIRQQLNYHEWPGFYDEWIAKLAPGRGDDVIRFDVHNWAENNEEYENNIVVHDSCDKLVCSDLLERFYIYSNGNVALCCADDNGFFDLGNVLKQDPIEIYNNEIFSKYRSYMEDNRIHELKPCRNCSIISSRQTKTHPKTT